MDSSLLSIAVISWMLLAYLAMDRWSDGSDGGRNTLRNTQK